jgi:histidinol-phosphate aminotransferase
VGLRDYYRQFQELPPEEVGRQLREQSNERKRQALERIDPIDLSRTTWPGLPHHYIVNAITYAARKGLHRYVDPRAGALRTEIANRHGVSPEQVVVGNGAAQLLHAAAGALLEPNDELVTPWPSYPLYPLMARRSHALAVPVEGFDADALLAAVNERTRIVVLCNPNDPTGELMPVDELASLLERLPERVVMLVDEALVDYIDAQAVDATLGLLERFERLVIFRSFSKAWGLAGLRCGFAIGAPSAGELLRRLEPDLGVNDLAQQGTLEALRAIEGQVRGRAQQVGELRERVTAQLRADGLEIADSQANVLWMRLPGVDGAELAARLERHSVIVQPGAGIGEPDYIRASVHLPLQADRLLRAIELALEEGTHQHAAAHH